MKNYKKLFIDIDNFDENKMSYIKPIMFYKISKNIGIYYNNDSSDIKKKQKIIVQTPKMIIPFDIKHFNNNDKESYYMSLSFTTLTNLYNEEEINKFFKFIKKIDNINEEIISVNLKRWKISNNLKYKKTLKRSNLDYPYYMNIKMPYNKEKGFLFNVYDENANKADIDILKKRSIVSVILELTDLKFNNHDYKANWNILQIRKFNPSSNIQDFFMRGCFICDEDNPDDKAIIKIINEYKNLLNTPVSFPNIPQLNLYSNNINPTISLPLPPPPPLLKNSNNEIITQTIFKPPSIDELNIAKNKLKKIETIEKPIIYGKIIEDNLNNKKIKRKKKKN